MKKLFIIFSVVGLFYVGESARDVVGSKESFQYTAINCREHTAILTDFGGKGDGMTSNTEAFKAAINQLSKFSQSGGALLYVPPGKWLTGPFNLTSHFTLFLHKDAVILASQVFTFFTFYYFVLKSLVYGI